MSEENLKKLVEEEAALDRQFIPVWKVEAFHATLVKYPFCKPKVIEGNSFFSRLKETYYHMSEFNTYIQAAAIKEFQVLPAVELFEDAGHALEVSSRELISKFNGARV